MQGKRKDDTDRFMRAIAAFSAAPENVTALGRLLPTDVDTPVHALLAEINETVLRRILQFQTGDGRVLALDVSERRVLEVVTLRGGFAATQDAITERALDEADSPVLLDLFDQFTAGADQLFVLSRLPEGASKSEFSGVSVLKLFSEQAAKVASDLPPDLGAMVEASKASARALVVARGEDARTVWGDPDDCDRLAQLAAAWASGSGEADVVTLWTGGALKEEAVLVARRGHHVVFLLCAARDALACFRIWQTPGDS